MSKLSRTERREAKKATHRTRWYVAGGAVALVLVVGVAAVLGSVSSPPGDLVPSEATAAVAITFEESSTLQAPDSVPMVEVPDITGKTLEEAERLLSYANLNAVSAEATSPPAQLQVGTVVSQSPAGGTLVSEGDDIELWYVGAATAAAPKETDEPPAHFIVAIDPGHQGTSNLELEPIGPGSSTMKEKVRGGSTGVSTRIPEYETVLQIALEVRRILRAQGVEVVMTRTTNDVDISNRQRAELANQAGADLFIRIHCDGAGDPDVHGASVLYPAGNSWVSPIETRSKEAATAILSGVIGATGAKDRGLAGRDDITGFNWSKVPAVLVEAGFLSNPAEDKLLSGDDYRAKVAEGIAAGAMEYLATR